MKNQWLGYDISNMGAWRVTFHAKCSHNHADMLALAQGKANGKWFDTRAQAMGFVRTVLALMPTQAY